MCWNVQTYSIRDGMYNRSRLKPFTVVLVASPDKPETAPSFKSAFVSDDAEAKETQAFQQLVLENFGLSNLIMQRAYLKTDVLEHRQTVTIPSVLEYVIEVPKEPRPPDPNVSKYLYKWITNPVQATANHVRFLSEDVQFSYTGTHALVSDFSVNSDNR